MTPISRREQELLNCVYKLKKATAKDVMLDINDGSSYSTIRTLLGNLVEKGQLSREERDLKYHYFPTVAAKAASKNALKEVLSTFFNNSSLKAANFLLEMENEDYSEEEIEQLERLLANKRRNMKEK